jgi:hypothetical protein
MENNKAALNCDTQVLLNIFASFEHSVVLFRKPVFNKGP